MVDDEFYDNVFDELYQEATPGVEEIEDTEYSGDTPVNYLHYLDGDRQIEIIEEYLEEYDVPEDSWKRIRFNVILGKSPSSSLEGVNRAREEEGLEPLPEEVGESVEGG